MRERRCNFISGGAHGAAVRGKRNGATGTERQEKKEKNGGSGCAIMFYDSHL